MSNDCTNDVKGLEPNILAECVQRSMGVTKSNTKQTQISFDLSHRKCMIGFLALRAVAILESVGRSHILLQ